MAASRSRTSFRRSSRGCALCGVSTSIMLWHPTAAANAASSASDERAVLNAGSSPKATCPFIGRPTMVGRSRVSAKMARVASSPAALAGGRLQSMPA
jgi:hypothetical protein